MGARMPTAGIPAGGERLGADDLYVVPQPGQDGVYERGLSGVPL